MPIITTPKQYSFTLDTTVQNNIPRMTFVASDKGSNILNITLTQNLIPYPLTDTGLIINAFILKADGTKSFQSTIDGSITIISSTSGTISVILASGSISATGINNSCEINIQDTNGNDLTFPQFTFTVLKNNANNIASGDSLLPLIQATTNANTATTNANNAATLASNFTMVGAYSTSVTYVQNNQVTNAGSTYYSKQNGNLNHLLTDTAWWGVTALTGGGSTVTASTTNGNIKVNGSEQVVYTHPYVVDTGVANAYIATYSPAYTSYFAGMTVRFKAVNANTSGSTININGLGVKTIYKSTSTALVTGDILANQIVEVVYDGTNFQMIPDNTLQLNNKVNTNDYVRAEGYAVDTGAVNAYVMTVSPAPTTYIAGEVFNFKAVNANTGVSTLNVNGLGVKTLKKDVSVDLVTGDILAGQIVMCMYDGTNFQIIPSFNAQLAAKAPKAVEAKMYNSGSQTLLNNTPTQFAFDSVSWDTSTSGSIVNNNLFTCRVAGKYHVTAQIVLNSATAGIGNATILQNGVEMSSDSKVFNGSTFARFNLSCDVVLEINDSIYFTGIQTTGGSLGTISGSCWASIYLIDK